MKPTTEVIISVLIFALTTLVISTTPALADEPSLKTSDSVNSSSLVSLK